MAIKRRQWYSGHAAGYTRPSRFSGYGYYEAPMILNSETVETFSHHRVNGHWSGGGPFDLTRSTAVYSTGYFRKYDGNGPGSEDNNLAFGFARVEGLRGDQPYSRIPQTSHPSMLQLAADGTTAIARTEPTSPAFDLSVFLGELRAEGLPNMPGTSVIEGTKRAKAAGGEYLNIEYGWLPLVSGIRDFAKTVEKSDSIVRSYQENANKVLQRSYEFPTKTETGIGTGLLFNVTPAIGFAEGSITESFSQRKWFEVEYQYYLPVGQSANDKFRRFGSYARKLYGVDISPEVLWNLSPWSWAADWFGNVGDVMHNISALGQDGLVMRNAYIMCHSRYEENIWASFNGVPVNRSTVFERKSRLPATPFGFGLSYSGLTLRQKAIAVALGLSRW